MSYRWSKERTLKFVSKYIEHQCLWNYNSPDYKKKEMKQLALDDIQKTMNLAGFGEREIKLKINTIRSTYSQELKKIKDSKKLGAGTDTVYTPSVVWFSLLDSALRNLTLDVTESEKNSHSDSSHSDTDIEENKTAADTVNEPEPNSSSPRRKTKLAQLSSIVGQLKEIAESVNSTEKDDEFAVFGKHVGIQLKSLPLLLAFEAQEHIHSYLNKIRRQHLLNELKQNRLTETTFTQLSSNDLKESPDTILSTCHNENIEFQENSQIKSECAVYFEEGHQPQDINMDYFEETCHLKREIIDNDDEQSSQKRMKYILPVQHP